MALLDPLQEAAAPSETQYSSRLIPICLVTPILLELVPLPDPEFVNCLTSLQTENHEDEN